MAWKRKLIIAALIGSGFAGALAFDEYQAARSDSASLLLSTIGAPFCAPQRSRSSVQDLLPACDGTAGKQQQAGEDRSRPVQQRDPDGRIRGQRGRKPGTGRRPRYPALPDHHIGCGKHRNSSIRACAWLTPLTMARRCARSAKRARSMLSCAMCYWGEALVLGPNINAPMDGPSVAPAFDAISRARALSMRSEREGARTDRSAERHATPPTRRRSGRSRLTPTRMQCKPSLRSYPGDDDIVVQYAESLMDLQPWDYWEGGTKPKGPHGGDRRLARAGAGEIAKPSGRDPLLHPSGGSLRRSQARVALRTAPWTSDAWRRPCGAHAVSHLLPRRDVQRGSGGESASGTGG